MAGHTELQMMLALDTLDSCDMRAFVTQTANPQIGLSPNIEIRDGSVLRSVCGYGDTYADALSDLWRQITELDDPKLYLVVNAGRDDRRAVRWNGVGFKPVYEPDRAAITRARTGEGG